jgi:hypothetical protein
MIEALITLIIYIIILGVIWYVLQWALDYVGIPEPLNRIARVILVVVILLILIIILLKFAGLVGLKLL